MHLLHVLGEGHKAALRGAQISPKTRCEALSIVKFSAKGGGLGRTT